MKKSFVKKVFSRWKICVVFSVLLLSMIVEFLSHNGLINLNNCVFLNNIFSIFPNEVTILPAKLASEIKENFVNLYISQISTTFLVTAFLSLLGDRDAAVYWTTAMDYKLVHPKGSGLKDFTLYSFYTLGISFIAMYIQIEWCFLFSFLINIAFLIIITWRMIIVFYNRDGIKKELKKQFEQESEEQQQEYLHMMEESMVRAAHNHNVEYLRECKEFLEDFITDDEAKELREDEQEVISLIGILKKIVKDCNEYCRSDQKTIDAGNSLGALTSKDGKKAALNLKQSFIDMYSKIQDEMPNYSDAFWVLPDYIESLDIKEVTKQLESISEAAKRIAASSENPLWISLAVKRTEKINNKIFHTNMLRYLHILPQKFIELQLGGMQAIFHGIGLDYFIEGDEKQKEERRKNHLNQALNNPYIATFNISFNVRERVLNLFQKNMLTLSEQESAFGLDILMTTKLYSLEDYFLQDVIWFYDDNKTFNFSSFLSDFIDLLVAAYNNHRSIDVYTKAILSLCYLIENGSLHSYNILLSKNGIQNVSYLPKEFSERFVFFTEDKAEELLNIICSKNVLFNNFSDIFDLLINVCKHTENMSDELKKTFKKQIEENPHLGVDREYILTYL